MKNTLLLLFCVSIISPALCFSQTSDKAIFKRRIALVIGNGNYLNSTLSNPENDARAIETALAKLDFTVYKYENLTQGQMKKAIDDFGMKLRENEVGLFYYAGHGIQSNGFNYLIPVDAQLMTEKQVEYDCVQADRILALMEGSGTKVNIIILDACRNNPFERSWTRSENGKGLAFMNAPSGTIIAYATSPGNTASDGSGMNGLYTSAILESISVPNITITQMFQQVRLIVRDKSNQKQTPWESTSLVGDFYFNPEILVELPKPEVTAATSPLKLPKLAEPRISNIVETEAYLYVTILSDGGAPVTSRGISWSTNPEPGPTDYRTNDGDGIGNFLSKISGLNPGETYYCRTFATNSVGTQYSNIISFRTAVQSRADNISSTIKPLIKTTTVSHITINSAVSGGEIPPGNSLPIITKGVCWSLSENPTVENFKTSDGPGNVNFVSNLTGLLVDTIYYVRAYCINYLETLYGNEIVFRTIRKDQVSDSDDNVYDIITIGNQDWMATNLKSTKFNDGTPIQEIQDKVSWSYGAIGYNWYDDKVINKEQYGALYSWSAVKTNMLCPVGWHVPTVGEWNTLRGYLGGGSYADLNMKKSGLSRLSVSDERITKTFQGFSAMPGGYRDENGSFKEIGERAYFWLLNTNMSVSYRDLAFNYKNSYRRLKDITHSGLSVRCIRD